MSKLRVAKSSPTYLLPLSWERTLENTKMCSHRKKHCDQKFSQKKFPGREVRIITTITNIYCTLTMWQAFFWAFYVIANLKSLAQSCEVRFYHYWYYIYKEIKAKKNKVVNLSKFTWEVSDWPRIVTQALPWLYWANFTALLYHSYIFFGDVSIQIFCLF